jgi:NAD(P)-dependent dehydrogenase (short-subunit alcohol dehydrogenase family)
MVDVWINGLAGAAEPARLTPPPEDGGLAGAAVSGALTACIVAGRHMAEHGRGVIVNLTTVDMIQHERGRLTESVIAGAVRSMTGALGVELAEGGVRVVGVALGTMATPSTNRIPITRLLTHDDVANAVLFVAGPTASFLTAETLVVDGGQSSYHLF